MKTTLCFITFLLLPVQLRAIRFPIVGYAARNCGTDSPQLENEVLLIA